MLDKQGHNVMKKVDIDLLKISAGWFSDSLYCSGIRRSILTTASRGKVRLSKGTGLFCAAVLEAAQSDLCPRLLTSFAHLISLEKLLGPSQ